MIHRATHSDKSIDDILQSIRNVINFRESEQKECQEDELHLTDVIGNDEVESSALLSRASRAKTESTLEDFIETATTLGHHKVEAEGLGASSNFHNPIEDFVMELLRPQLKEWLDINLPNMVKQIVSEEIKSLVANIQKNRS